MNIVEVTLIEIVPLTRVQLGEHTVVIETEEEFDATNIADYFTENLEEFRRAAAREIASSRTDYDSFGSDSAYLDRLDAISEAFYLAGVSVPGVKTRTFEIEGSYPSDGGPWGECVESSCLGEAEFQAKWQMSENDGYNLKTDILDGVSPQAAITALEAYMDDQEIISCDIARPTAEDAVSLIRQWLGAAALDDLETLKKAVIEDGGNYLESLSEEYVDAIVPLDGELVSTPAMSS